MSKSFTMADAENWMRFIYITHYKTAGRAANAKMIAYWYERGTFSKKETALLMQMNLDLQKEIGTPEPSHVREMTKEDMIRYLRPELWRAERNILQENHIPKPMLPPDGRREKILERNYDVAIVKMIYELFPDEPRKLTRGDLMAEFFDDPTPGEAPAEPDPGVSP